VVVIRENRSLQRICGEADAWIIAQALEYSIGFATHDRNAATLARALGVDVATALD
jgi:hypothetical protein